MELTTYMQRDMRLAGTKAYSSGVADCHFSSVEWADLWQEGWGSTRNKNAEA